MKKMTQVAAATLLLCLWIGQPTTAYTTQEHRTAADFFPYTWYYDADMTEPVGTVSYVNTEMERLRALYPGNVFSSSYSSGLRQFEYGYYYYYPAAIIYTDLPWALTGTRDSVSIRR